jgi:hypothetical protein
VPSMPDDPRHAWIPGDGRLRWHGAALIAAGMLFGVQAILLSHLGRPPSGGAELVAWRRAHVSTWAWLVEATALAPVFLIPGLIGLWRALRQSPRAPLAATGLGMLAAAVPVILVLSLIGGRLVFAIYGIGLDDPAIVTFAVTTFVAGEHEVSLLIGAALLVLAGASRGTRLGGGIAALGAITGVSLFAGAYPSVTGLGAPLAAGLLFTSWLIAAGTRLRLAATRSCARPVKTIAAIGPDVPTAGP